MKRRIRYTAILLFLALILLPALAACAARPAPTDPAPADLWDGEGAEEATATMGSLFLPGTEEEPEEQKEPEPPEEPEPEPEPDPAEQKIRSLLASMTKEEKVAQLFFVGCPASGAAELLDEYPLGGYVLFASTIADLTADGVRSRIAEWQGRSKIPLLIGADEEGGTVVRISSNPRLRDSRFRSPKALYKDGGMEMIVSDTREKSELLLSLGVNVNLAPVCDVTSDENAFMYSRSFGGESEAVCAYVTSVVENMCAEGIGSVLKHFPGYGNCGDTHENVITDHSTAQEFEEIHLPPFRAGAEAGAGAVMVCHNIVEAYDGALPASLSPAVHEKLREELGERIVVMTDDLAMKGVADFGGKNAAVQALLAGNDILLTSEYRAGIRAVTEAVEDGTIPISRIEESVARILAWKIELGLIEI